jgi:hypothetical protein
MPFSKPLNDDLIISYENLLAFNNMNGLLCLKEKEKLENVFIDEAYYLIEGSGLPREKILRVDRRKIHLKMIMRVVALKLRAFKRCSLKKQQ